MTSPMIQSKINMSTRCDRWHFLGRKLFSEVFTIVDKGLEFHQWEYLFNWDVFSFSRTTRLVFISTVFLLVKMTMLCTFAVSMTSIFYGTVRYVFMWPIKLYQCWGFFVSRYRDLISAITGVLLPFVFSFFSAVRMNT